MQQHPSVPPWYNNNGMWLPPKALGCNYSVPGDTTSSFFFFDGQVTRYPVSQLPTGLAHFRTCSLYYHETLDGFWAINYDATQHMVGNGAQQGEPQTDYGGDDSHWGMDWARIGFVPGSGDENDYTSYVTCAPAHERLLLQKDTQIWAKKLFPERYHADLTHTIPMNHPNQRFDRAGLIGELPLILGLVAFSAREEEVSQAVQYCVYGNTWRMHNFPRRRGCW